MSEQEIEERIAILSKTETDIAKVLSCFRFGVYSFCRFLGRGGGGGARNQRRGRYSVQYGDRYCESDIPFFVSLPQRIDRDKSAPPIY